MSSAPIRYMKNGDTYATLVTGGSDTANLQSAVDSIGSFSGNIYIGAGVLSLNAAITVTSIANNMRIVGAGKGVTTINGNSGISCFDVRANFVLEKMTLDGFGNAVDFSNASTTIDRIDIRDVEIKNYNRGIYGGNTPTAGVGVDKFTVENCDLTTGTSYAIFVNSYVIGKSIVRNCRIKTFKDRGISFGNNTVALNDIRGPYEIEGNYVEDGINASSSAVNGIIVHGWRARIVNNEIRDIRRDDPIASDCEGIYTKCRHSVIANNILVDAGQGEAMINLKGGARNETVVQPYGYQVICANNNLVDTQTNPTTPTGKRTSGIKIATSECLVIGNEISGMCDAGIYDDSDNGSDTPNHNILVTNNVIKDSRGKYGIVMFGRGDNVRIVNNLVDTVLRTYDASGQSFGIQIAKKAGAGLDVSDNRVKNIVNYGQTPVGIFMSPSHLTNVVTADPSTDTFTSGTTAHCFVVNDQIKFTNSGGGLPAPLVAGTIYYIKTVPTSLTFTISATLGGATLDITTAGTGTHTAHKMTTHTNWCVKHNNVDTAIFGVQFSWDETYADVDGCYVHHNTGRNINGNTIPVSTDLLKYSDSPTNLISWVSQNEVVQRTNSSDSDVRNGTTAQSLHVYGTYTDASNYERLTVEHTASASRTIQEVLGTGVARPYEFGVGANKHRITTAGNYEAMTDATFDFGGAATGRFRDMYISRDFHPGRKLFLDFTNTAPGTTGNQTINKPSGRVNIAAGNTSVVVTNNLAVAADHPIAWVGTNDANKTKVTSVVAAAGSFTINVDPAPAAEIIVNFVLFNT